MVSDVAPILTAGATIALAVLTCIAVRSAGTSSRAAESAAKATARLAEATERLARQDVAPLVVVASAGRTQRGAEHGRGETIQEWEVVNVGRGPAILFGSENEPTPQQRNHIRVDGVPRVLAGGEKAKLRVTIAPESTEFPMTYADAGRWLEEFAGGFLYYDVDEVEHRPRER